jgi:hypothetical protein
VNSLHCCIRHLLWFALICVADASLAADVQPRLFTNIPVGVNFISLGYTRSEGNVTVDPSIAVDVDAKLNTFVVSYSRAFGLFGQSALFTAGIPYADLTLTGIVQGESVTASGNDLPDPKLRLAMNLYGAPALKPQDFAGYKQKTIVGVNIEVSPPLGDYDKTKLINFGSNRWTVTTEVGLSRRVGRFTLEAAGSLTFFSDNTEYLVDNTLQQDLIGAVRANVIFHFRRPGTWIGVGGLFLSGGETSVNGEGRRDLQTNSRLGVGLSIPFGRRHNLLLKFSSGVTTRIGADFDNYGLVYTYLF